jgi:hypothetical protein
MPISKVVQSIVEFLRKGYPEGVPEHDYIPLFALLRRRLSDEEATAVANELIAMSDDPGSAAPQIRQAIESLLKESASDADIARVQNRLTQVGWSLENSGPT